MLKIKILPHFRDILQEMHPEIPAAFLINVKIVVFTLR